MMTVRKCKMQEEVQHEKKKLGRYAGGCNGSWE